MSYFDHMSQCAPHTNECYSSIRQIHRIPSRNWWFKNLVVQWVSGGARKTLNGENDIDTLCLQAIHELMKDGTSRKKLSPRDIRALKRAKIINNRNEAEVSNLESETPSTSTVIPPSQESSDSTCTRTLTQLQISELLSHFINECLSII